MAAKTININSFTGMSNLDPDEGLFVKKGVVRPRIILNADVTVKGRLKKRDGQVKKVSLIDGHSMWAGYHAHLVMDGVTLKRVSGNTATEIGSVGMVKSPVSYAEVGNFIYVSNKYYNGIFNPDSDTLSSWGITLPNGPVLSATNGTLPAGTYEVCFTRVSGLNISGNGPVSIITLNSEGGIVISNRPVDAIVWCTERNDSVFQRIGAVDIIVNIPEVEPLPSLFCNPPPYIEHLTHAFGRMWGARGRFLHYSEALHLDWWKYKFEFATDIGMVAKVKSGLFVGCDDRTYFMQGTDPEQMEQIDVGAGAVPWSLCYGYSIKELGDTISPAEKVHNSVPGWVSKEGVVLGNAVGRVFNLSKKSVKFSPGAIGASLYRNKNGQFQFLASFKQGTSGMGLGDTVVAEVVRNGVVM